MTTFTMSIEPTGAQAFQYGFGLGTEEMLARQLVEERFRARNEAGMHTCTIALIRDRKIVDVFDGRWSNRG